MTEDEHLFPCTACGSDMEFDPESGALVCGHCGDSRAVQRGDRQAALAERDFRATLRALGDAAPTEERRVLSCPNCGARIEFDPGQHAAECPYCATPVVTDTGRERQIKPAAVVPFALTEDQARKAMAEWLGRLWFAPSGLQAYARKGRAMQGIYAPFWTFDADTRSAYRGERGDYYYETHRVRRTVNGKSQWVNEQVRKIRWRPAAGRVARFFNDVLVLASRALPQRYTDAVGPWKLEALEAYSPEFLAGFRAEAYSVPLDEGFESARAIMARVIESDVRHDIGGDTQRIHVIDTDYRDIRFKHVLLPVWVAAYRFRGKSFRFVVNGQTGRVAGERPWSWVKISVAVVLALIVLGGFAWVMSQGQ